MAIETASTLGEDRASRKELVLFGAISMFIGALLLSNITASKLYNVTFLGLTVTVPVGTSLFALTFLSTDVVSEVWGRRYSAVLIASGLAMRLFSLLFLYIAVAIPPAPIWTNQVAYASVLTGSRTILLAGILTYPISQLTDIFIFHRLKKRHGGRNLLWLRNNVSTMCSQTVDSTVFIALAFGRSQPMGVLVSMVVGQVIVKWLIAVCDTPLVYVARNLAQGRKLLDVRG